MGNELMMKEMNEAVKAGEQALQSLYEAKKKLESAKQWGWFDLFGGGFLSNVMKHSRMQDAAALMEQAKFDLCKFQRELKDIQLSVNLGMEVDGFLCFADFFFDGVVADYLVQSKIHQTREQVNDAIEHVENVLNHVKKMRTEV
jgi:hypothetical protein